MKEYLLSIVIPTKNRYSTLFELIETLCKVFNNSKDVEIVIHDNSDNNEEAEKFITDLNNDNVKYYYENKWLSVGDNCDRSITNASGKYICFIGDDDAVAPSILDVAKLMDSYDIESCGCDYSLYRWPTAMLSGSKSFEYSSKGTILRIPKIKDELKRIMSNGIQNKNNLPGVYHGIVKKELLDKIYQITGTYFPGPSPDMANSISLSLFVNRHIMTSIPFVVDGYSKASTGHLTEAKKHIGKLEEQSFLPKDTIQNWSEVIPKIWLPNTIWPESALQAIKRCNKVELIDDFNYTAMYIKIYKMYPQCREICLEYLKKYSSKCKTFSTVLNVGLNYSRNRFKKILKSVDNSTTFSTKEMSVFEAVQATQSLIDKSKMVDELRKALEDNMGNV